MRNIFKRKNKRPSVNNKVVNYNPKPKTKVRKRGVRDRIKVSDNSKRVISGVLGFLFILLLLTMLISIISSPRFYIQNFSVIGNKSVTDESINQILSDYKNRSIFITSNSSIEEQLLGEFVFFKSVKVRKEWPDTIKININEREPRLVMINLNGAYLIDEDGRIIDILSNQSINFSEENLDIIAGLGNPDADYVIDRLEVELIEEGTIDPESEEEFDFSTIELSRKLKVLEEIENELKTKSEENFKTFNEEVRATKYGSLSRVFVYDNKQYNQFEFINIDLMQLSIEISKYFNTPENETISRLSWEGEYLANVRLTNGKEIIFGTARNISEQIEDYKIISNQIKIDGKDYNRIDLSSKKVSVK